MGYELHITRAPDWAENEDDYIRADEWLTLVEADAELTLDTRNGPHFARWSGLSDHQEPWFDWFEGNIHTKYPDPMMLAKMLEIADKLGAKVQGDDGEMYESEDVFPGPLPERDAVFTDESRMPAYMRREMLWSLVAYGTIAIMIVAAIVLDLW